MRIPKFLTVALLAAAPLAAQDGASSPPSLIDRLRAASKLPTRTAEAREAGVPDSSIRTVMDVFRRRNTPPTEAEEILTTERDAAREHGPTDNFGAFVQTQMESGKRGRELSEAIRAEHQARGKGKPQGAGGEHGQGGRPEQGAPGRPAQGPESHGGKPDSAHAGGKPAKEPSQGQGQQGRGRRPN